MSKGSASQVGGKLVAGLALAGVTLGLLLLSFGLGQAEVWVMLYW